MDKNLTIANFNVTFGVEEEPLLNYFDEIVLPALTETHEDYKLIKDDNKYYFMDVEVKEYENQINKSEHDSKELVLTGILVKETILEIKSQVDEKGDLHNTDLKFPSAPYSLFIIFLRNHRMVLVKNQKGSPDIRNFRSTVEYMVKKQIAKLNKDREKGNKLPYALVNVVGIPNSKGVKEALKDVKKVRKLSLKFYPLNGEIDYSSAFSFVSDLRLKSGSQNGAVDLLSPNSKSGVEEIVSETEGLVMPIMKVDYKSGGKGTITDKELSENISLDFRLNNDEKIDANDAVSKVISFEQIKNTSEENLKIYKRYLKNKK